MKERTMHLTIAYGKQARATNTHIRNIYYC